MSEEDYQTLGLFVQVEPNYDDGVEPELSWQEYELFARPGMQFDVHGVRCLNESYQIMLHEARIGTDDYKLEGPIDVAVFNTQSRLFMPMRLGVITNEVPLVLCMTLVGSPSIYPEINLVVFGKESVVDEAKVVEHREVKAKMRNGPNIYQEAATLQRLAGFPTKVVQYIEVDVPANLGNVSSIPEEVAGFEVRRKR